MVLKQQIYNHYLKMINDKVEVLQNLLSDLKESSSNETKSTAGDKHETALAMLQIEQANVRKRLTDVLNNKASYEKIDPAQSAPKIATGSLIKTNHGFLFLSIALGKATIDGITVTALSPQSPLGSLLMDLIKGDIVKINNATYAIESVM